jgi:hypothetical protein
MRNLGHRTLRVQNPVNKRARIVIESDIYRLSASGATRGHTVNCKAVS